MSTYYTLLKRNVGDSGDEGIEIGIDERSNKFDLHLYSAHVFECMAPEDQDRETTVEVYSGLSFEDLRKIRDHINEVLSYFDEDAK